MKNEKQSIKRIVKESYGKAAEQGCGCLCNGGQMDAEDISKSIGYSENEIKAAPKANLGLGCGNPTTLGEIKEGETVLDLGSGAGFDCFLAVKKVGKFGKVIGIDMTPQMIALAKKNAESYGYKNVEFRQGEIENLPVKDNSVDVIISNCVINLSSDKPKVFKEAYRVLRNGGRMFVSDMVLLKELTEKQKNDKGLIAGCVGGAMLKDQYVGLIKAQGFETKIISEDKRISSRQYNKLPVESLKLIAGKKEQPQKPIKIDFQTICTCGGECK